MPASKRWSSADLDAMIERVAPDVLTLLADGVARSEAAIIAALVSRHAKDDVTLTVMRLNVVGRLDLQGGRYTLPAVVVLPASIRPPPSPSGMILPMPAAMRRDDGGAARPARRIASPAWAGPRRGALRHPHPKGPRNATGTPEQWTARRPRPSGTPPGVPFAPFPGIRRLPPGAPARLWVHERPPGNSWWADRAEG
jgi:hypothetical protein